MADTVHCHDFLFHPDHSFTGDKTQKDWKKAIKKPANNLQKDKYAHTYACTHHQITSSDLPVKNDLCVDVHFMDIFSFFWFAEERTPKIGEWKTLPRSTSRRGRARRANANG
jgi:hypothetical protein